MRFAGVCAAPTVCAAGATFPVSDPETKMAASSPLMSTYAQQPTAFTHGDGVWLFDTEGRRYLDCLAGIRC